MSGDLHDIDKIFQDAINNHEEMPPSSVWDDIDKNLDKNKIVDIRRKYSQLKRIAAALLLLLIGAAVYMLQQGRTGNKQADLNEAAANEKLRIEKIDTGLPADKEPSNDADNKKSNPFIKENGGTGIQLSTASSRESTGIPDRRPAGQHKHSFIEAGITTDSTLNYKNKKSDETASATKHYSQNFNKAFRQKITITNAVIDETGNTDIAVQEAMKTNTRDRMKENKAIAELARIPGIVNEKITAANFITTKNSISFKNIYLPLNGSKKAAQQRRLKIPKQSFFSVTGFYAPNITSFRLENDHHEREHHEDRDKIKGQEQNQTSATVGLLVDYNFKKSWSVQSGFTYTTKKINIEPKKIYADLDNDGTIKYRLNCSSGYTYVTPKSGATPSLGDSVQTNKSLTSLQYIAIPLSLKYSYSFKKLTVFGTAGTSVNFLTRGNMETEIADNTYTDKKASSAISGLKSTFLGGSGGIGIEYNIGKNMALTFMPSYNFAITSITQNSVVKSYPNSFSMAAGVRFKL